MQVGLLAKGGDPFVSLRLSGHCAFFEVRSAREAAGFLRIAGLPYRGTRLRISRPTKYPDGPSSRRDDSVRLTWPDMLDDVRALVPQVGSPDPDRSDEPPLPPLSPDVVTRLGTLTNDPTNVLIFRGALRVARASPVSISLVCFHGSLGTI